MLSASRQRLLADEGDGVARESEKAHLAEVEKQMRAERARLREAARQWNRRRAVWESATIYEALDAPVWVAARTGTRRQAMVGRHRVWVFEKSGAWRSGAQLRGQKERWGKGRHASREEAMAAALRALHALLRKEGLLLPRDDPEVAAELW